MNRIILPLLLLFCIQAAAQNPENIVQTLSRSQTPTATEALIKVVVSDKNERPVNNLAVSMLCRKTNKLYSSKTDITGEVRFFVLINNDYEINVDTEQNYRQISIPNKPNLGM
ncbi:MAG: hypothetical protein AB7G44_03295, partial [Bacteroidia bacterium]